MKLILGMVSANRKLNQIEKCISPINNYSKPFHFRYVSGGFERVGYCRFARKYVEIKGNLSLLPIFVRRLIIE